MRISDWSSDVCSSDLDEALHHVGADHVGAVAGDAPARQVEALGDIGLAGDTARADVVAEGRRIAERRAAVAADEVEPGERAAGELLGLEIVERRSKERRGGKEGVSTSRTRGSPDSYKKQ